MSISSQHITTYIPALLSSEWLRIKIYNLKRSIHHGGLTKNQKTWSNSYKITDKTQRLKDYVALECLTLDDYSREKYDLIHYAVFQGRGTKPRQHIIIYIYLPTAASHLKPDSVIPQITPCTASRHNNQIYKYIYNITTTVGLPHLNV